MSLRTVSGIWNAAWPGFAGLRELSLAALKRGDARAALAYADRLCRRQLSPSPSDFLTRAFAYLRLEDRRAFLDDLGRAIEIGWCEPIVLRALIATHPDDQTRLAACRFLITNPRANPDDVVFAVSQLTDLGASFAARILPAPYGVIGWVALRGTSLLAFSGRIAGQPSFEVPSQVQKSPGVPSNWNVQAFEMEIRPAQPVELTAILQPDRTERSTYIPRLLTHPEAQRSDAEFGLRADLVVVIPVYADPQTLDRCLRRLQRQESGLIVHFLIVDDCSDDERVTALGRTFCADVGGTFVRHSVNAGFAAAVNSALDRIECGDVLILNSDVELPERAITRMRDAAHSATDIGTVAPLSNDAGSSSFPRPFERNTLLSDADAAAVDAAAARVNLGVIIDVVCNLGSCLYITDRCRRAVLSFSLGYGRGYYEDVDYCFRAHEAGFRNVVAPNIYVGHASSRSFGAAKRQLAAENRIVVETRFPDLDAAETTFMRADPLRPWRALIEENLAPASGLPVAVVAASRSNSSAALEQQCRTLAKAYRVLVARWTRDRSGPSIELRAWDGRVPQSLCFTGGADGVSRFARYCKEQAIARVDLFDSGRTDPDFMARCLKLAPCHLWVASRSDADFVRSINPPASRSFVIGRTEVSVHACDALSAACTGLNWQEGSAPAARDQTRFEVVRLGVLLPEPCAQSEHLVLSLARRLRRRNAVQLTLFGECLDEAQMMSTGNVWVHGRVQPSEGPELAARLGVSALISPYRDGHFGWLDTVARKICARKAFFDWSDGRIRVPRGDLALRKEEETARACDQIVEWCEHALLEPCNAK